MPTRIRGISNLIYSAEEMTVPRLSSDGMTVEGWVVKPSGAWTPEDLLWTPPNATKSTDLDRAGSIIDVLEGPGEYDWITAQLNKREKYLDAIRAKVRAGAVRLTASLAKFLGMDFDDGAQLTPRQGTGTLAYRSATHKTAPDPDALSLARTLRDTAYALGASPRAHKSWCSTGHPADTACEAY